MSQPLAVGGGSDDDNIQIIGRASPLIPHEPQPEVQDISDPDEEEILNNSQQSQSSGSGLDCPICLQSCVHPVELPCRHIFCFLCIKGVVTQGVQPRCAICRQDVPANVLTNPTLKDITQLYKPSTSSSGFIWYYESRGGGWWEYDVRTMQELEKAYEAKLPSTQLLIAGHLYEIDFSGMIQFRVGNRNLFRRIKRDVPRTDKRGIAGIRLRGDGNPNPSQSGNTNPATSVNSNTNFGVGMISVPGGASNFSTSVTGTTHSHPSWSTSGGGGRRTRAAGGNSRHYSSSATLQSVIDGVARNITPGSPPVSSPPGNSVTFFIPLAQNGDSRGRGNGADAHAETETDGDDDESLDEEEDDEDMRFGEEDETTEEEDCDDFDVRDGARAPTSRSDRSTSSSNHNQSPPVRNGGRVSRSSTRASTTTPVDVQDVFPFSPVPMSDQNGGSRPSSSMTPTSPTGNLRIVPVTSSNSPLSVANNNGSTCIRIGPSLRITVDYDASGHDDEVL